MPGVVIVLPAALLDALRPALPPLPVVRTTAVLRGAPRLPGSLSGTARTPGRLGGAS